MADVAALQRELEALRAVVASQQRAIDELRSVGSSQAPPEPPDHLGVRAPSPVGRRRFLAGAGLAAVGGAAAVVGGATPAAAADGATLTAGATVTSQSQTELFNNSGTAFTNRSILLVDDDPTPQLASAPPAAITGHATGRVVSTAVLGRVVGANGNGVAGVTNGSGNGVVGITGGDGAGVLGQATGGNGRGGVFSGPVAAIRLLPNGFSPEGGGPPPIGVALGDLEMGADGTLSVCTRDDFTQGLPQFHVLAGPATAGSLHVLAVPQRVYDSREPGSPSAPTGRINTGASGERVFRVQSAVPQGARAALLNITITETIGAGFLAIFEPNATYPGHSNINWTASGQTIANSATTAISLDNLSSRGPEQGMVRARVGGAGASTHLVVDVFGFYR